MVRNELSVGRDSGIEGSASGLEHAGCAGIDIGAVEVTVQRKYDNAVVRVGGVGNDPATRFAGSLSAGSFRGRELDVARSQQLDRIHEQPRLGGRQVENPQLVDGVISSRGPAKQNPLTIATDDEGARCAESESLGCRVTPGVAHIGLTLPPSSIPEDSVVAQSKLAKS